MNALRMAEPIRNHFLSELVCVLEKLICTPRRDLQGRGGKYTPEAVIYTVEKPSAHFSGELDVVEEGIYTPEELSDAVEERAGMLE